MPVQRDDLPADEILVAAIDLRHNPQVPVLTISEFDPTNLCYTASLTLVDVKPDTSLTCLDLVI